MKKIKTIMPSRKSLLFNNTDIWIKKNEDPDFNVTMEGFDSAELCEVVDLYISTFWERNMENIGLVCIAMMD